MTRVTGTYRIVNVGGEKVRTFLPYPLPPKRPSLAMDDRIAELHANALNAVGQLATAGTLVPSTRWFLYGFVRKEAVITSQIEGTQATLEDVCAYEATRQTERPADVQEVCNYIDALEWARAEMQEASGLPLCTRLLCMAHARLMRGVRGAERQPGVIRTSQNWIGGTRPGNARFVPPPPDFVPEALGALERWIHAKHALPPLVRAGLAHAQFETIHPFLDGNGRIGRLLVALLVEHWGLLSLPLLYLSVPLKRHRQEYYQCLTDIRTSGNWEAWIEFFLRCVQEAADDGVAAAGRLSRLLDEDRRRVLRHPTATMPTMRLFDVLPEHPMITLTGAVEALKTTKPTATKAIDVLCQAGVLKETTGKRRDRVYAYRAYLDVLAEDTAQPIE